MTLKDQIIAIESLGRSDLEPALSTLRHSQRLKETYASIADIFKDSGLTAKELQHARAVFRFIYYRDDLQEGGNLHDPSHRRRNGRTRAELSDFQKSDRQARDHLSYASREAAKHGIIIGFDSTQNAYYAINLNFDLSTSDLARVRQIIMYLKSYMMSFQTRYSIMKDAFERYVPDEQLEPEQADLFSEAA